MKTGYYKSAHGMMYCDGSLGPLLMRKEVVKQFTNHCPFPFKTSGLILSFLAIENLRVIHCPDCMFHVKPKAELEKTTFLPLAERLGLNQINFEGKSFSFSCEEVKIRCDLSRAKNGVAQPPCCLGKNMTNYSIYLGMTPYNTILSPLNVLTF